MERSVRLMRLVPWIVIGTVVFSCDTEKNTEDPDLHYFVKYYGGDGDQSGVDMELLDDGSMLLLGNSTSGSVNNDLYLVRVDATGEVIWEKTFRAGDNEQSAFVAKDLEPTKDGNFVILADSRRAINDPNQIALLKISADGVLLDSAMNIGTPANDYSRTVTSLDDGGYIVTGTTEYTSTFNLVNNPDPDFGDFFNYRLDANLDLTPANAWGPISPHFTGKMDVAVRAIPNDDTYYVFGYSNINLNDTNRGKRLGFFYFQRGSSGTEMKAFFPGNEPNKDTEVQYAGAIPAEMGGGYLIVGTSRDDRNTSQIFLARMRNPLTFNDFNSDILLYGAVPLSRNIQGVSGACSVTGSFGYLLLGNEIRSTSTSGVPLSNIWLTKIDQSGGVMWSATFGSESGDDTGAAVRELPDGKIVILGTMGLKDNQSKMALIKINSTGQLLK